jgi:carbamoyl-phosphate synthase large subunit
MNVLFVGGGRRTSLAKRFKQKECKVFAYELDCNAPILSEATIIPGLCWRDCVEDLASCIREYNIDIVIPLQDKAVEVLANMKWYHGLYFKPDIASKIVVSKIETAAACLNKKAFEEVMKRHMPECYPSLYSNNTTVEDSTPVVVKPKEGYGSRGIKKCCFADARDSNDGNVVIQREIFGSEYTVDAYFNRCGQMVGAVPRLRQYVAGGEIVDGVTCNDKGLINLTAEIGKYLEFRGPICVQFIKQNDLHPYIIEANARFGGGCILSLEAGFDMVQFLICEYCNNEAVFPVSSWKIGVQMRRVFNEVFIDADCY